MFLCRLKKGEECECNFFYWVRPKLVNEKDVVIARQRRHIPNPQSKLKQCFYHMQFYLIHVCTSIGLINSIGAVAYNC